MSADNSTARKGGPGGGASAESYIGSLIVLTSKSEVRYEGVLFYINTEESSIGLRNVRSFGTEGRKKDGPQVPPSDKIYEYMLFRGSDIKNLQVKSSAAVQRTPPITSDPAIIQSHYSHPTNTPMNNLPAAPNGSLVDQDSHSSSIGLPSSTFQSNLPLYHPGTNLNSWAPSPLYPNGGGLAMPMHWQGFYGSPNVMPQQTLLRPPSFLSIPPSMQQMQFSGFSSSSFASTPQGLPTSNSQDPQFLLTANNTTSSSTTSTLPASTLSLNMPSLHQLRPFESETMINQPQNVAPISSLSTSTPVSSFPSLASLATSLPANSELPSFDGKPSPLPGPASLPQPNITEPRTPLIGTPPSHLPGETLAPSLVTPGELLQSGIATVSSSQPSQAARKDVEVLQVSPKHSPEPSAPVATETQPPLLPLPPKSRAHKPNGGGYHMRNKYRGRAVGGSRVSRPVTKFTEDFDFTAMNEKFNKDEVWGHLGKKAQSKDRKGSGTDSDSDDSRDEDDNGLQNFEIKAVYNKDDFFDSLSSNASNNGSNHVRTRYSEQMKLDTETFGYFTRYRGGRGYNRRDGGGRFSGSYYRVKDPANRGREGRGRGKDTTQNRS